MLDEDAARVDDMSGDGAGSQFDARVVEVCVVVLSDLRR